MVPDAAECGAISRRCRVARRSPRWCGGDWRARSCGPGGTARSAVPAQPIGHLSKRHHQFHLSWPEYWDRTQGLTDPSLAPKPHATETAMKLKDLERVNHLVTQLDDIRRLTGMAEQANPTALKLFIEAPGDS